MADYSQTIRRNIFSRLAQALTDTPVVLVNGARQTGKSTLVLEEKERQYLTFDDPGMLAAAKGDPNGFIVGLNTPVTLDEVQQAAVDRKHEPGRFLLTGSANTGASQGMVSI
jgi:uncharacterized protein